MENVQSRFQTHRSLSETPDEIQQQANQMYDTDDKCCPCLKSCFNSGVKWTYTQIAEEPDVKSDIVISKENPESAGYEFEAQLVTVEVEYGEEESDYKRHILTDVKEDGPADQMLIKDCDEIVLLNDETFAPEIDHNEVLQIFGNVKIGGQSAFKMVIRRKRPQGCCGGTKWKWVELTATFSLMRGDHPITVESESHPLRKNKKQLPYKSLNLYKFRGTQRYITIDNRTISAGILEEDENDTTKYLWKHCIIEEDGYRGRVIFVVALSDFTRTWYIAVGRRGTIYLNREPVWFQYSTRGSYAIFKSRRGGYFMAYDHINDQLTTQTREYWLEQIPVRQRSSNF